MSVESLKYLSEAKLSELRTNISSNYERYTAGDFLDLANENGWSIELGLKVDLDQLKDLNPASGADSEVNNSMLVWRTFKGLSPALASEERVWVRLAHIECLEFSRKRWLKDPDRETGIAAINAHYFAGTQTSIRDDHAISRLWWSAYVAHLAMPDNLERALKMILRKADFRSNLIERSRTGSRPALAAGILRAMYSDPRITKSEDSFRAFMKTLNRLGGGELFEVMQAGEVDAFIRECADRVFNTAAAGAPAT